jgi:acyl-CoA thioester hydrolase
MTQTTSRLEPRRQGASAPPSDPVPGDPRPGSAGSCDVPGFSWPTRVFFDELDAMGMLHNARYSLLIERATSAFFESNGWQWERDVAGNPDQHYVVREQSVRFMRPILRPGRVVVSMWVSRLGETSATFSFEIRSPDRRVLHATAERVHVKLDRATLAPAAWTPRLREHLSTLLRSTQASSAAAGRENRAATTGLLR